MNTLNRWTAICCCAAVLFIAAGRASADDIPAAASVNDKYSKLLHKLEVPGDTRYYSEFYDWGGKHGKYSGTSYYEYRNLSPGYWVYVAPNWYIWEKVRVSPLDQIMQSSDLVALLVGKQVKIVVGSKELSGEVVHTTHEFLVLRDKATRKILLVGRAQIAMIEWPEE